VLKICKVGRWGKPEEERTVEPFNKLKVRTFENLVKQGAKVGEIGVFGFKEGKNSIHLRRGNPCGKSVIMV